MKNNKIMKKTMFGLACISLMVLPGCGILDFIRSKMNNSSSAASSTKMSINNDSSKVLLTIGGETVITENSFNEYYNNFIASNPRLQSVIQFMPNAKKEIFSGMVNEKILLAWGMKNNIHTKDDYKKELETSLRMIKVQLAAKQFEKDLIGSVTITDAEMRTYYDGHKDPELVLSPGGITAEGKMFATKELAQTFYEEVKDNSNTFKTVSPSVKIKKFDAVNNFSIDIDKKVKEDIVKVASFPSVIMTESSDHKYWVILASKKEEKTYRPFDEVKDGLKKMIEREKMMKIYSEKIEELKKQYNVIEDVSSFKIDAAPVQMPSMPVQDNASMPKEKSLKAL